MTIAIGATAMAAGEVLEGQHVEIMASRHPCPDEMDAYERVLGDAMAGDATLFARQDYVEEAWRIVDPALRADTPVYEYEQGSWGPSEVEQRVSPEGGWHNPTMADDRESKSCNSPVLIVEVVGSRGVGTVTKYVYYSDLNLPLLLCSLALERTRASSNLWVP